MGTIIPYYRIMSIKWGHVYLIYSIKFYKEELRFNFALIMIIALKNMKLVK